MISNQDLLAARILIVDDPVPHLQQLREALQEAGYGGVAVAHNPHEVFGLHQQHQYDLILLGLDLPGRDGYEVMEELQLARMDPYLPIIVVTQDPTQKVKALQAGAKDFISKPFDPIELTTRVNNMLEVRLLYRRLEQVNQALECTVQLRTAQLQASEARFRRATELAADWYWEQNEEGVLTQVSGQVEHLLGLGLSAFLGQSPETARAGWNVSQHAALCQKIANRQPFLELPISRLDPQGERRQFRISGEPMFDDWGTYTGYRGVGCELLLTADDTRRSDHDH